jgi:general secretion pathway protein G
MMARQVVLKPSGTAGFTLIELLITVAIIALLAAMVLPVGELAVQRDREHDLRLALREIRSAIDAYKQASDEGRIPRKADESGYPKTLELLVEGVADAKSPDKERKIYFLRRLPRDPMATDPQLSATETWGKRSYKSPPESPQAGEDVFDVFSQSNGVGLNGIPYRQW